MPSIPLVDLAAQYQDLKPEIDAAIARVLEGGHFILGPEVEALEREVAAYCGTSHAVAVASGTDALELALRAAGLGPGDEVITTAFSFFATASSIVNIGATPVFVDLDPVTYALDPAQVEAKVSSKTKAILPVHLYGHPCDMDALARIAQRHKLAIIEDCAQAIGAEHRGRKVGSFGLAGCFSFYPTKNLGAYGDAGMVVTSDARVAEQVRLLRIHGSRDRARYEVISRNSRLDELQAAVLRVKLPHLDAWNAARRQHAARYQALLKDAAGPALVLPHAQEGSLHVFHLYVIRVKERDRVQKALVQAGVGAQIHYPYALPHQPVFASLGYRTGQFPVAERAAAEVISLPAYPELTPTLVEQVVSRLLKVLNGVPQVGSPLAADTSSSQDRETVPPRSPAKR